ncbi:MAG: YitT family protein [Clostridiales bacterium]|nr:YitT family protein [Clostridiales bacterium]MCF8022352.1 YitT family protein [Clostridiales bacterium]
MEPKKLNFKINNKILYFFRQQGLIAFGALVTALGYTLFQVPFNITAGGLSGLAIIVNHFTGWSEGILFLIMNIPLVILGFYNLDRWKFIFSVILSLLVFSFATDIFIYLMPKLMSNYPITDNILLSAFYAGIVFGLGNGLIFKGGGCFPGTTIIGRIIQNKTGLPLSQTFLYTDSLIILSAGIIFGWEMSLLAFISLFFSGVAADFVLEGSSQVRSAMVITENPGTLKSAFMEELEKGVTEWEVTGGYTKKQCTMLYCVIHRSQINELKNIIGQIDQDAFVIIGLTHQAFGGISFPKL